MSLFKTTDEQKFEVYEIAQKMTSHHPKAFVAAAAALASESEGVYDLFTFWAEEEDEDGRNEIIAAIQDAVDDAARPLGVLERGKIGYDSLDAVVHQVLSFKKELRLKVDKWGGVAKLAEATGMAQPSLSRFFNSASMPRQITLFKIAKALDLPEEDVVCDWHQ